MQMCKAKNASHIRTASTATEEYLKAKTANRRLHKLLATPPPTVFRVRSVATEEDLLPARIQKSRGGPTQAAFGLSGGHPAPLPQPDRCVSHPVHPVLNLHCRQTPRHDKRGLVPSG